jgi:hypothetical protein
MRKNPDFKLELGLLWLADSLAKIETRVNARTDKELQNKSASVKRLLSKRRLPQRLFNCAIQLPVNIALAEKYMKLWAKQS